MQKTSTISIATSVLFERINAVLSQQGPISLPGNITILSLKMRADETWLYAEAEVKGPIDGTVIAQCKPAFNNDTKRFTIHDLNIELGEDNFLAKLAGKFVNNMIAEKVDGKLEEVINEKFTAMLNDVFTQMRNISLQRGAVLRFDTQSYKLYDVRTNSAGMHFTAELTGIATLEA